MKKGTFWIVLAVILVCVVVNTVYRNESRSRETGLVYDPGPAFTTSTPRPSPRQSPKAKQPPREPYVGMAVRSSEKEAWEYRGTDNLAVKGEKTTAYHYDTDTRSYDIWVDEYGIVVKVSLTERGGKSSSSSGKKKNTAPALNTSDFVSPEDFYDWYRDDFYDYEEAEDYYYSHGGK